jgi:hypothetical protein
MSVEAIDFGPLIAGVFSYANDFLPILVPIGAIAIGIPLAIGLFNFVGGLLKNLFKGLKGG